MKQRRLLSLPLVGGALLLSMVACTEDWRQSDPPAGTDRNYAEASFVLAFEDPATDLPYSLVKNPEGQSPEVTAANDDPYGFYGNVLHLNGGAMTFDNPLKGTIKGHFAVSFYVMETPKYVYEEDGETIKEQLASSCDADLFSAYSSEASKFIMTGNGGAILVSSTGYRDYNDGGMPTGATEPSGAWHWVVAEYSTTGYAIYVDGYKRVTGQGTLADYTGYLETINNASTFKFGDEVEGVDWFVDNITVYNHALTDKIRKDPRVKKGGESEFEYLPGGEFTDKVGTPDCSAGWWSSFSNYFRIPANETLRLEFTNHTSGANNWNNWNLAVTTDDERGGGKYSEFVVLRSDLYGWGGSYDGSKWTNTGYGDWDQFRKDMEGANVVITIARSGKNVTVDAVNTALNGTVYRETITFVTDEEVNRAFLIVDGSYLELISSGIQAMSEVPIETKNIGTPDCSAGWWTNFSDYFTVPANTNLTLNFTNHTSGANNWNNWNLALTTDDERGGGKYSEFVVLRSDLYGWGGTYGDGKWSDVGYGDWDAFRADMEGADVTITVSRSGKNFVMDAVNKSPNGKVYREVFTGVSDEETNRVFLIVDGSYLEMKKAMLSKNLVK